MEEEKSEEQQNSAQTGASGPPQPDELPAFREKLARAEKERDEYLNGWKRAKADLINYQKEEMARMEEAVKFGSERLMRDAIAVLDSFDLALAITKGREGTPEAEGLTRIRSQLEQLLQEYGLEPIHATGEQFNPAVHEAIGEIESEKPPGIVAEEVSRGWKLYTKVVRPARVKISKGQKQ